MKRVLIVDDDTSFLESLKDGLRSYRGDFEVVTAPHGKAAVKILQASSIDLLVTDLKMPEMDGFQLLAWVSRNRQELPVIVMTAFGTPRIETSLSRIGGLQYLEKPVDLPVLRQSIFSGISAGAKSYITGITLATFLQLMRMEQKSCTLKIFSSGRVGYLYIRQGELLDAEVEGVTGNSAALEIIAWDNPEIEMVSICWRRKACITMSMEHLLIQSFQQKDERDDQQQAPAPAHKPAVRKITDNETLLKRLRSNLRRHPEIIEHVIFDKNGLFEENSSGSASTSGFDPAIYTALMKQLDRHLGLGAVTFLLFNTKRRYQCLFFKLNQKQVLLKLEPGVPSRRIVKELLQS